MNARVIRRELEYRKLLVWPLLVIKIIIEMLLNGTAPSAVSKNIESTVRLIYPSVIVEEVPNIDFVRESRGLVTIMSETAAACEQANNPEWAQTFWDNASRRTTALAFRSY